MHDSLGIMRINRTDGGLFALSQFDYGRFLSGRPNLVTLTGFYADNSSVTQELIFLNATQTLVLSSAWAQLTRVEFVGQDEQAYDNFVFDAVAVNAVPEPASLALLSLALAGVGALRVAAADDLPRQHQRHGRWPCLFLGRPNPRSTLVV